MADQLRIAQQWLADQLERRMSREVTYQQGNTSIVVSATVGRTLLKLEDNYGGIQLVWTDRDYLIPSSALVAAGQGIVPKAGDRVIDENDSPTTEYEVMPYGDEPVFRPSDPYGIILRIHTKVIAQEVAPVV